jgi:hypothetical protein
MRIELSVVYFRIGYPGHLLKRFLHGLLEQIIIPLRTIRGCGAAGPIFKHVSVEVVLLALV